MRVRFTAPWTAVTQRRATPASPLLIWLPAVQEDAPLCAALHVRIETHPARRCSVKKGSTHHVRGDAAPLEAALLQFVPVPVLTGVVLALSPRVPEPRSFWVPFAEDRRSLEGESAVDSQAKSLVDRQMYPALRKEVAEEAVVVQLPSMTCCIAFAANASANSAMDDSPCTNAQLIGAFVDALSSMAKFSHPL